MLGLCLGILKSPIQQKGRPVLKIVQKERAKLVAPTGLLHGKKWPIVHEFIASDGREDNILGGATGWFARRA